MGKDKIICKGLTCEMERDKFFHYKGFTLERTGCFLSGDGCKIIDTPSWIPSKLKKKMINTHAQDSVVMAEIKNFWKRVEKLKKEQIINELLGRGEIG